jgi:LacI family gluconate utilization system Gnt-I transcriptional repressor
MEDVARVAGVSLVTVSRAINTPDKLKPETLSIIRNAISKLGYVPNLTAGSLASNRSRIIGAIVPTISNSLFADTIDGLSERLAREGYQLLLGQTHYQQAQESALVEAFLGRRVDGIVLTGVTHGEAVRTRLKLASVPVVETWDITPEPIDMIAGFSNENAGAAVARWLMEKGYTNLGFIGAQEERSMKRLKGFIAEVERQGGAPVVRTILTPPSSITDGGQVLASMMAANPQVRAIFCGNDSLAAGVLFECQRQGWAVPERLAIVGFADLPIAMATMPGLTTVQVQRRNIGTTAGDMLLARLAGGDERDKCIDLGFEIIERGSA